MSITIESFRTIANSTSFGSRDICVRRLDDPSILEHTGLHVVVAGCELRRQHELGVSVRVFAAHNLKLLRRNSSDSRQVVGQGSVTAPADILSALERVWKRYICPRTGRRLFSMRSGRMNVPACAESPLVNLQPSL